MITIIYHLYSDKKSIIDIKLYKSLVIKFISDIRNKEKKKTHTTKLPLTISVLFVTL